MIDHSHLSLKSGSVEASPHPLPGGHMEDSPYVLTHTAEAIMSVSGAKDVASPYSFSTKCYGTLSFDMPSKIFDEFGVSVGFYNVRFEAILPASFSDYVQPNGKKGGMMRFHQGVIYSGETGYWQSWKQEKFNSPDQVLDTTFMQATSYNAFYTGYEMAHRFTVSLWDMEPIGTPMDIKVTISINYVCTPAHTGPLMALASVPGVTYSDRHHVIGVEMIGDVLYAIHGDLQLRKYSFPDMTLIEELQIDNDLGNSPVTDAFYGSTTTDGEWLYIASSWGLDENDERVYDGVRIMRTSLTGENSELLFDSGPYVFDDEWHTAEDLKLFYSPELNRVSLLIDSYEWEGVPDSYYNCIVVAYDVDTGVATRAYDSKDDPNLQVLWDTGDPNSHLYDAQLWGGFADHNGNIWFQIYDDVYAVEGDSSALIRLDSDFNSTIIYSRNNFVGIRGDDWPDPPLDHWYNPVGVVAPVMNDDFIGWYGLWYDIVPVIDVESDTILIFSYEGWFDTHQGYVEIKNSNSPSPTHSFHHEQSMDWTNSNYADDEDVNVQRYFVKDGSSDWEVYYLGSAAAFDVSKYSYVFTHPDAPEFTDVSAVEYEVYKWVGY
jgi:hypothetical protein